MARSIPERPEFGDGARAERTVWQSLLRTLPDDAVVLVGQRLTYQGAEREIDLLVLWPGLGCAVIEVKGGRLTLQDGQWFQSGRRMKVGPLEQAQKAKHTLIDYLRDRISYPAPLGASVHMAAFPHTTLPDDWAAPEAPREILADSTDLDDWPRVIRRALDRHRGHFSPITDEGLGLVLKNLRRTHHAMLNVRAIAQELERHGNELTENQASILDLLRYQRRAQFVGGAGSGKTHLALQKARRLAREGKRVALLCYSRGLGRYFELTSARWPASERPAFVGLFHDLALGWGGPVGADDDSPYWEERLPAWLATHAAGLSDAERFDAIIVDEAQDFSDLWWEALVPCLREGADGVLYVFADEHQRVFDRNGRAPIELSPFALDANLRNTASIARVFAAFTPGPQQVRGDVGDPVEFVDVSTDAALSAADDAVEALLDEGWDPGQIALLTTKHRHPEHRAIVENEGYGAYWDQFFAADEVFYGHVLGFKGLERSAVVLCLNGFSDDKPARSLAYVGLSRARSKLVVVGDRHAFNALGGA